MILPRGITSFDVPKGLTPPDVRAFVADCWAVALPRQGRVEDRDLVLPGTPTSFVARILFLPRGEFGVLLNSVHPWVGFCRPLVPGQCQIEFADAGRVAGALASTGRYRVLSVDELERPVEGSMLVELGRGELSQVKYWGGLGREGRLRVGDLVFNFWD